MRAFLWKAASLFNLSVSITSAARPMEIKTAKGDMIQMTVAVCSRFLNSSNKYDFVFSTALQKKIEIYLHPYRMALIIYYLTNKVDCSKHKNGT